MTTVIAATIMSLLCLLQILLLMQNSSDGELLNSDSATLRRITFLVITG